MPNRTSTGLTRTPDCCAARFIAVNRVAARTVKRPESISVRGVFQPADLPHTGFCLGAVGRPQVMPQRATGYFINLRLISPRKCGAFGSGRYAPTHLDGALRRKLVKVQNGRLGLVLRRGRNLPLHRQMRQERRHLLRPHISRMPFAVKQNEPPYPIKISCLGANAVMPRAQMIPHALQQLGLLRGCGRARECRTGAHPRYFRFA